MGHVLDNSNRTINPDNFDYRMKGYTWIPNQPRKGYRTVGADHSGVVFLHYGAFSRGELVSWALKQTGFTPAEKLVLIGLIWHCNSEGSCAFSNARLKEELGLSLVTVSRAIRTLSSTGLVKNTRRFNNSSMRKLLIDKLILDKY
mgnify:FL=1